MQNVKVISRENSDYFKTHNPYTDTRAREGREADTIIYFAIKTPTGKWSKFFANLRFNSERNLTAHSKQEEINEYYIYLINKTYKQEIKKGYTIAEVILYSGRL